MRKVTACLATIELFQIRSKKYKIGKAIEIDGEQKTTNKRCSNEPVDHPHGGGEGKTWEEEVQFHWGQSAKGLKTRRPKEASLIITRRKKEINND